MRGPGELVSAAMCRHSFDQLLGKINHNEGRSPMYVHRLILDGIKGFENLDFTFIRPDDTYAGWTVFTGGNGSGKSTLLKSIAVALAGPAISRSLQPSFSGWISHNRFPPVASIQIEVATTQDDGVVESGNKPPRVFPAKIELEQETKDVDIRSVLPPKKGKTYKSPERTIWSADAKGWFSCGYGPFRRVFGASEGAIFMMVSPGTARFATMFQEAASLVQADKWIRELNYKALEDRERPQPDGIREQDILDSVTKLLNDDFMPNGFSVKRVDSNGVWLQDIAGNELAWNDMSDGYRAALALMIDIFRHLVSTFGPEGLVENGPDGKAYVTRAGVVLIDEIDAHLHPEWQQCIGFWMKRHFPKIQFLVTSHSPLVCQAADPNGLFVLPDPASGESPRSLTVQEYQEVVASRADTILRSAAFGLLNTRSAIAVNARADLAKLRAKERAGAKLSLVEATALKQLLLFDTDEEY